MRPERGLIDRKWELRLPKIRHEERQTYLPWDAQDACISLVMKVHFFFFDSRLSLLREIGSSAAEELEYQRAVLWICFDNGYGFHLSL
jgi:hypothetical protein